MSKNSKKYNNKKNPKSTITKYLFKRILLLTILGILVYVAIYLIFLIKGGFPTGNDLKKSDWLSFLGVYLSFFGTVAVSLALFWHTNYVTAQAERKMLLERKKHIQPIFSIQINDRNLKIQKVTSFSNLESSSTDIPPNFQMSIENVNEFPVTNVIVFGKYISPLLKPGEKKNILCSYFDKTNKITFSQSVIVIDETDYDMSPNGLPNWFYINYDDIDGNSMYQTFELKHYDEIDYYSLKGIYEA